MASPVVTNTSAQLNGASLVYGFATTLTDAQIKALPTTPITVVAAPGVGKRIKVLGGSMALNNSAGAYTNINTDYCALLLQYATGTTFAWGPALVNDSTLANPLTQVTTYVGGTVHKVFDMVGPGGITGYDAGAQSGVGEWVLNNVIPDAANVNNSAVQVTMDNNGSGVLTGGNAANALIVTVYYAVEAI